MYMLDFVVPLPPGVPLDTALKRVEDAHGGDAWRPAFRWVMNAALYVTMPEARCEHGWDNPEAAKLEKQLQKHPHGSNKRERMKERLKGLKAHRVIYVDPGCPEWTNAEMGLDSQGRQIALRIRVAGHHKLQAHGPNRTLRKRIFVEPYWRGPEDGEVIAPVHVVK